MNFILIILSSIFLVSCGSIDNEITAISQLALISFLLFIGFQFFGVKKITDTKPAGTIIDFLKKNKKIKIYVAFLGIICLIFALIFFSTSPNQGKAMIMAIFGISFLFIANIIKDMNEGSKKNGGEDPDINNDDTDPDINDADKNNLGKIVKTLAYAALFITVIVLALLGLKASITSL